MSRESTMRYKKPRARSATDKNVTIDAFATTLFFILLLYELYEENRTDWTAFSRQEIAYFLVLRHIMDSDVED